MIYELNIFANLIIPPAVPKGRTMLIGSISALHEKMLGKSEKAGGKSRII